MLYWLYEILLFAWLLWSGLDEVVGYCGLGKVILLRGDFAGVLLWYILILLFLCSKMMILFCKIWL